ncbi:replication termination factor 2 isoform X2 [Stegostoma tigrinum]|uniref:replication termination factor 2 isoform X2 n=1 Tax=Stegostoma tigrinum TaxID=3053191 RepID=UPI00202ADBB5|nr:replication termination factor 2 isoform X2 [Stegostoma tigrinum]
MGCDGGTIPKRHELVKGPKKVEQDVKELNLTDNPAWRGDKANAKGDKYEDLQGAAFICPVVGLEMNGRQKFCYLRDCGCVFSERAMKEIKTEVCHKCGKPFKEDDVIILNGSKEEIADLRRKMEERKLKAKLLKKAKKSKAIESFSKSALTEEIAGSSIQKPKETKVAIDTMLNGFSSSSSAANAQPSSSSTSTAAGRAGKPGKAASGVTKRPLTETGEKSEAYKSIFTSHSSAKRLREEKPNWITHTAYYY